MYEYSVKEFSSRVIFDNYKKKMDMVSLNIKKLFLCIYITHAFNITKYKYMYY
jgi:hypothetical protein